MMQSKEKIMEYRIIIGKRNYLLQQKISYRERGQEQSRWKTCCCGTLKFCQANLLKRQLIA